MLFFDTVGGLNNDNNCSGCHSPAHGFGDTQSIAIGIDNNGIVGHDRAGPRNQRRTPMLVNAEQVTGNADDRYKFRTSPIRNVALQPAFFHNGAFTTLEDAVRHHLDVFSSARGYNPGTAGIAPDLTAPMGPTQPMLARIDPILANPIRLTDDEFRQLVDFVRNGLLDKRAKPERLKKLIPKSVPSGFPVLTFQR